VISTSRLARIHVLRKRKERGKGEEEGFCASLTSSLFVTDPLPQIQADKLSPPCLKYKLFLFLEYRTYWTALFRLREKHGAQASYTSSLRPRTLVA
jgi:hypothetical protein